VRAGAGENWDRFVRTCLANGWFGLENLVGIPGRVGAGPIQNIGAYGVEMEDFFDHLVAVDLESGEERRFDRRDCGFGYRNSRFKTEPRDRFLITAVTFTLLKTPRPFTGYRDLDRELADIPEAGRSPAAVAEAVARIRARKLPDPKILGNAGSFFKNPVVGSKTVEELLERFPEMPRYALPGGRVKVAAGWLIDRCGWKGRRHGRCGVHDRQALVLVNHGGATGVEIVALAQEIQESVYSRFGIRLEPEPRIV
jgi:UDP-N-acetylmuramate dehydrogenase